MKKTIDELLKKKLKEFKFDNYNNDITGIMDLLTTDNDKKKMYDYIINNHITDTDDIYKYGFHLANIDNQNIIIQKED